MKALVTGGAGFIGSHLQDRLIGLGYEVAIVDNLRSGKKENLNPKARFHNADIRDSSFLNRIFAKFQPELVFHLAAQNEVPYSMKNPFEDQEMNIVGTMDILELCHTHGVRKIVYSNTGGAFYGEPDIANLPLKEDYQVSRPTSFYGVSKLCAEMYLKLYGHIYNIPWVSLRYSNVYGPRQDGNKEAGIVAIFTQKMIDQEQPTINGNGLNTRDYIYVQDVVESNILAIDCKISDTFNISTGIETTNNQVFETIEKELKTGIKPIYGPPRAGDPFRICLSPEKAKKILKWVPKTGFQEGVLLTLKHYNNQET